MEHATVRPNALEYDPAAHARHAEPPVPVQYRPAGHATHEAAEEAAVAVPYIPAPHAVHWAAVEAAVEYVPAMQLRHCAPEVMPSPVS